MRSLPIIVGVVFAVIPMSGLTETKKKKKKEPKPAADTKIKKNRKKAGDDK